MSPSIDVDEEVFEFLKDNAEPFVDTPNSVLRRMLGVGTVGSVPPEQKGDSSQSARQGSSSTVKSSTSRHRAPRKRSKKTRAAAGTLLPEDRYERPLLQALVDAGGEAPYRDVVEKVGEALKDQLMPADFETLASGGIRWQSRLQFVRLRLIERGAMDREAPRGIWRITDAGRATVSEKKTP